MAIKRKKAKFVRTDFRKYSKLGVRRKKKQVYRKSKGRDNKIRLNMKGHTKNVSIGYRTKKQTRDLVEGLRPIIIYNLEDLKKISKENIGIIGKIGSKKRKEILDKAIKENIKLSVNIEKALEKIEEKREKVQEKRKRIQDKKIFRNKKAQKEAEKKAKKQAKEERKSEDKEESIAPLEQSDKENKQSEKIQGNIKNKPENPVDSSSKKEIKSNNYGRGN